MKEVIVISDLHIKVYLELDKSFRKSKKQDLDFSLEIQEHFFPSLFLPVALPALYGISVGVEIGKL